MIDYANNTLDKQAYNMLTMARLITETEDMEDLSVLATNLSLSNYCNVLHDSLSAFPRQEKVSFDELGDVIDFITLVQN